MTQSQRFIEVYYNFSERCGDDFDIMTKAFKLCGCRKKPNVIRKQLEDIDAEKSFCEEYVGMINKIEDTLIERAKWSVQKERGKELTLPFL